MNEVWNLDPIYTGFDDPAFASDMELLAAKVEEMNRFSKELATVAPLEGLRTGIALEEETSLLAYKLAGYAQLRQSTNTRDSEAGS
jgi:oligoendopeptidase F